MGKINTNNYPNRPVSAYQDDDMFILQDNGGETYTTNVGDIKDLIEEETAPKLALKVDKNGTDRLMTAAEGTKLAGIAAGAQVNVLEGVVVDSVEQPISGKKAFIDLSGKANLKVIAFPFHDPAPGEPQMGFFKGAYVTYNGKLYEFTQEHQGAWNPSHVREIDVDEMYVRAGNGGYNTGDYSTTEGNATRAEGEASHAEGTGTIANSDNQHVEGKYNIPDTDDKYAHIVGNGTSDDARSNALTLDWDGNLRVSGDIADGNGEVTVEGNPVTFESPFEQDAKSVVVSVKPIQAGSGTPSPENIRPISGIDELEIGVSGKNKWSLSNSYTSTSHGDWVQTNTPYVLPAGQYTLSYTDASSNQSAEFYFIDASDNVLVDSVITSNGARCYSTITLSADSAKLAICMYGNVRTISDIQLELGSTPTAYEPYNPNSHTTTIPLPSTLYDADVDVTEGSGTDNGGFAEFDGTEDVSWQLNDANPNYTHIFADVSGYIANIPTTGGQLANTLFNEFKNKDGEWVAGLADLENGWLNMTLPKGTVSNVNDFKAWLAQNPLQIAYELATPTTISLTPTDVELLEGMNVVSTNAEKVAVTYGRSLWQDIDKLKTDTEGKLNKSDVADVEGDTASKAYSVNEFMLRADGLYKVTQPIAQNASITASNTTKTTIGAVLTALLNA